MEDRFICPDDHTHGSTVTCYVAHKCRCDQCRASRARRERERKHRSRTGTSPLRIPADDARDHIRVLRERGWRIKDIEKVSGVASATIQRIGCGRTTFVSEETHYALIGTTEASVHRIYPPRFVSAIPSQRRVKALMTVGWSGAILSRHLGYRGAQLAGLMTREQVTLRTHTQIAALYARMVATPVPSETSLQRRVKRRARSMARAKGWAGPMDWNNIDDLDEQPETEQRVA